MCNAVCTVRGSGISGFKTDTHMELMVLFVDIQNSFSREEIKICVGCANQRKVASYCFRCNGYLCIKCYNLHLRDGTASDHYCNLMVLSGKDPDNFTLEELSFLTDVPKCRVPSHDQQPLQECCTTCEYRPICMKCVQQDHSGHNFDDVTLVAKGKREKMYHKINILRKEMKYLDNLRGGIDNVRRKLDANVTEKRRKILSLYDKESSEITIRITENNDELERAILLIDEEEKEILRGVNRDMNEEILAIKEKYQRIIDSILTESENKRQKLKIKHLKRETNVTNKEQALKKDFQNLIDTIVSTERQNSRDIESILEHSENILIRLHNIDTTVSSIFGMRDDWKDVLYLPDINAACDSIFRDVVKEFPQLEELSDIPVSDLKPVYIDHGTIPDSPESVVDIEGINARGWEINGMATVGDGNIVVTGKVSDEMSHITVINSRGKHQRQPEKRRKTRRSVSSPFRYCAPLTETKVATTCQCSSNFIAIYDVRNGSFNRKDITDVITKERSTIVWNVSCIAANSTNKQILVGSFNRRDVYVFTDQLKHSHTYLLPAAVRWPRDMNVCQDNLIVCDDEGRKACLVTMPTPEAAGDILECELICEIPKPCLESSSCRPICLCTDKVGFIYMLWDATIKGQLTSVLTQYSQNGRQLLTKRPVDGNARSLATMATRKSEKLLIATERTGKLYSFELVRGSFD